MSLCVSSASSLRWSMCNKRRCISAGVRQLSSNSRSNKSMRESATPPPVFPRQIFSGIQPTSVPHIGNYFGAIKQWVELQTQQHQHQRPQTPAKPNTSEEIEAYQQQQQQQQSTDNPLIVSIVDLHAITVPQKPESLNEHMYKCAATIIACGIDPARSVLYVQSRVPYHGQLAWILGCLVTMPQLGRMHQFRFKSDGLADVPLGLYTYPVLQAADILLYRATHVPVGDDQMQHLELCRDIALKFNNYYGVHFFPAPKPIESDCKRLLSLRDPSKKMSKSDADANSRIELTDAPPLIDRKLRKAVTDAHSRVTYEPATRPGVATLVDIEAACTGRAPHHIVEQCCAEALDTGMYKKRVAHILGEHLAPIQARYAALMDDRAYLRHVLDEGARRANQIAERNFHDIMKIVGSPSA